MLPKTAKGNISQEISFNENITAPVRKGAAVGTVTVKLGDETLGEIPVTAAEDVALARLFTAADFKRIISIMKTFNEYRFSHLKKSGIYCNI